MTEAQIDTVLDIKALDDISLSDDSVRLAVRLKSTFNSNGNIVMFTGLGEKHGCPVICGEVAMALALMNSIDQVLLIDSNFHNSNLYRMFNAPKGPGLEEIILSKESLENCINNTSVSGLSFLPAGNSKTPIISQLFVRDCESILRNSQEHFSVIIVNSSGLLANAESVLIASQVDLVILCAEKGNVVKSDVKEINKIVKGVGSIMAGVVLTHAGME